MKTVLASLTLGPQAIPAESVGVTPMLLLAAVHAIVMAAWLGLWSAGLRRVMRHADGGRWRRRIDRVGGAVLVALGMRTAVASR